MNNSGAANEARRDASFPDIPLYPWTWPGSGLWVVAAEIVVIFRTTERV